MALSSREIFSLPEPQLGLLMERSSIFWLQGLIFFHWFGSVTNPVGPPETLNKNHQTSEVQNGMDFFLPPKKEKTPWVLKHIFGV